MPKRLLNETYSKVYATKKPPSCCHGDQYCHMRARQHQLCKYLIISPQTVFCGTNYGKCQAASMSQSLKICYYYVTSVIVTHFWNLDIAIPNYMRQPPPVCHINLNLSLVNGTLNSPLGLSYKHQSYLNDRLWC